MKQLWAFCLFIILLAIPGLTFAVTPNVPYNVTLTSTTTTITVEWSGDSDADGYYVYWGTTSNDLARGPKVEGSSSNQYTITALESGTTYYVAVSSYNSSGESNRSEVKSIDTTKDAIPPETPTGLKVTSVQSITEDSVALKWDKNIETDLDYYNIYYGTSSGSTANVIEAQNDDATSFTVSGLLASTRYYFSISAVDISGKESDKSQSLIVDTLVDTLPPYAPAKVSGALSNINQITITIADGNAQMADFTGNILFYGTTSGNLDNQVDLGKTFTYSVSDLPEGTILYFSALSYDYSDNQSARTDEASAVVEKTKRYLNQPEDFDGGCFIRSAATGTDYPVAVTSYLLFLIPILVGWIYQRKNFFILLISCFLIFPFAGRSEAEKPDEAPDANIAGIFAGYYLPTEPQYEDFYGKDTLLVTAFYERQLTDFISVDLESGYMKEGGNLLTESGDKTSIGTDLTIVPVAASVNVYRKLIPFLVGYFGAGLDYWYCKEETDSPQVYPKIEEWVGGCHAKTGVKLYNTDERFKNTGAIIETSYSWISKFGSNNTDIGGWAFKFGLFYQF